MVADAKLGRLAVELSGRAVANAGPGRLDTGADAELGRGVPGGGVGLGRLAIAAYAELRSRALARVELRRTGAEPSG